MGVGSGMSVVSVDVSVRVSVDVSVRFSVPEEAFPAGKISDRERADFDSA